MSRESLRLASLDGISLGLAPVEHPRLRESVPARLTRLLGKPALHEFVADGEDGASATAFALLAADGDDKPVLWLRHDRARREEGCVYAPGVVELGVATERLVLACTKDDKDLLKAAVDGLRCDGLGAVVIELCGRAPALDLTASRRMMLAAERSGVRALLVRIGAEAMPSAAWTRWRVEAAPSTALEANAPGKARFEIELLRDRGGCPGFAAELEWNRDERCFEPAELPRGVVPLPVDGAAGPGGRRAA